MIQPDTGLLQAALIGYEVQHGQIVSKMDELRKQLNGHAAPHSNGTRKTHALPFPGKPRKKYQKSEETKQRMRLAMKKRWAKARKTGQSHI